MENEIISILKAEGAAHVGFLQRDDAQFGHWLRPWLACGCHGEMSWMSRHMSLRSDPCSIIENGRSIISVAFPYLTPTPRKWQKKRLISNYAWGEDYHTVLRKKLKRALETIKTSHPAFNGRICIDSAPIPEKQIAAACGVGWIGRNSLLISPRWGSYLFLAEIICNLDLTSTPPISDGCGDCDECVRSCPNQAILNHRTIDARRCASYLTIEKRGVFSTAEQQRIHYHLFGCDCCQLICPWNEPVIPQSESPFACDQKWLNISLEELSVLTPSQYEHLKIRSPLKRLKLEGIQRNAQFIIRNHPYPPD